MEGRDLAQAPRLGQGPTNHAAGEGPGRLEKTGPGQHHAVAVAAGEGRGEPRGLGLEGVVLVGQEHGGPGQGLADPRVEARLQVGDQLLADAVAQEGRVGVRRVFAPGESTLRQVSQHVQPAHLEQRPHHVARAGAHGAQASGPGAPQQAQEERLGLVVLCVGHGDGHGPFLVHDRAQERVALAPGRVFEAALLHPGAARHVRPAETDGHPEVLREVGAERRVRGALGPQAVVEVRGHEPEPALAGQGGQGVRDGDGVRPSGKANHQGLPGSPQPQAGEGLVDHGGKRTAPHDETRLRRKWWRCRDSNPGRRGYEPRALTN